MLGWLIKTILISLAIVLISHNIYRFLLDRLTTEQTQTYVLKDINQVEVNCSPKNPSTNKSDSNQEINMHEELTSFLLDKTEDGIV